MEATANERISSPVGACDAIVHDAAPNNGRHFSERLKSDATSDDNDSTDCSDSGDLPAPSGLRDWVA